MQDGIWADVLVWVLMVQWEKELEVVKSVVRREGQDLLEIAATDFAFGIDCKMMRKLIATG